MIDGTAARFWMFSSNRRKYHLVGSRELLEVDRGGDAERDRQQGRSDDHPERPRIPARAPARSGNSCEV